MGDGSIIAENVTGWLEETPQEAKLTNLSFDSQPQDVDSLAETIRLNTALIMQEIFTRLPNLQSGQKIIVDFGEIHENGADITLITNVIHETAQKGLKCAFAVEWPPNNIDLHIDGIDSLEKAERERLKEKLAAPEHALLRDKLSCDTTPIRTVNARLNRAILHQYMDNHQIPAFCADAQRDWKAYLDNKREQQDLLQTDRRTAEAISEAADILHLSPAENGYPPINALHQFGMLARNIYTAKAVINDIIEPNPNLSVVFIGSGRSHTVGNDSLRPEPSPYLHSLSAIFHAKAGHAFIGAPLYATLKEKTENTPQAALTDSDILHLNYTQYIPFNSYIPLDAKEDESGTKNNFRSDIQESHYIESMTKHLPWINETLNGKTPFELFKQRKSDLLTKLEQFRDEHNPVSQKEEDSSSSSDNTGLLENQP